jgi:hypothetical protein
MDLLEKGGSHEEMQFFINKRSLPTVCPGTQEVWQIFTLVRQNQVMAMLDTKSKEKKEAKMSKKLLNNLLPELAPALYSGLTIVYLEGEHAKNWLRKKGIDPFLHPFPFLLYQERSNLGEGHFFEEKGGKKFEIDAMR